MSTFVLKLIACVTMFIDHYTEVFVPQVLRRVMIGDVRVFLPVKYLVGRGIGRVAFPIYCFLLVEGFFRTKDRRKYMLRMALFALVSEIPFDLVFQIKGGEFTMAKLFGYQNVMITLLFGLILMYIYEWIKMNYLMQPLIFNTLGVFAIVGIGAAAAFLKTDYGMGGVLLIMVFYLFRGKKLFLFLGAAAVMVLFINRFELLGLAAFLPIFMYSGKRGPKVKYAFYSFYPVHLLLLCALAYM